MNGTWLRRLSGGVLLLLAVIGLPEVSSAVPISYDEIIYQTGNTNGSMLSGTIDMTFASSTLTITLTNTSANGASTEASGNLLTGIAFNLPGTYVIGSGSVIIASGSTASAGYNAPTNGDVSKEWGYDNSPLKSGGFLGIATTSTGTAVSGMESQTDTVFAAGSLFQPRGFNGPSGGLLSANQTPFGGLEYIQDSVVITLILTGSYGGNLLDYIDANGVVLSFGSPTTAVPEPSTMLLLGSGLLGLGLMRRRRS